MKRVGASQSHLFQVLLLGGSFPSNLRSSISHPLVLFNTLLVFGRLFSKRLGGRCGCSLGTSSVDPTSPLKSVFLQQQSC